MTSLPITVGSDLSLPRCARECRIKSSVVYTGSLERHRQRMRVFRIHTVQRYWKLGIIQKFSWLFTCEQPRCCCLRRRKQKRRSKPPCSQEEVQAGHCL